MVQHVVPVILSGGSGSRLWPVSRKSYPKQFWPLLNEKTLIQETALRGQGAGFSDPIIICNKEATSHNRCYRPWGFYESLIQADRFQVKRIVVEPGAKLSLQKHFHRAEHWVVVGGTALVTRDDDLVLVRENESVYLPLGCVHRLENPGKIPLTLIEVQSGPYLGEDDIVRIEDVYARS